MQDVLDAHTARLLEICGHYKEFSLTAFTVDVCDALGRGADPNCKLPMRPRPTFTSWVPGLCFAAAKNCQAAVMAFLAFGCSVDIADNYGETALFYAVLEGTWETVAVLLQAGADPNHMAHDGERPVHMLAWRLDSFDKDIFNLLVAFGADLEAPILGYTPSWTLLQRASLLCKTEKHLLPLVSALLDAGAVPDLGVHSHSLFSPDGLALIKGAQDWQLGARRAWIKTCLTQSL